MASLTNIRTKGLAVALGSRRGSRPPAGLCSGSSREAEEAGGMIVAAVAPDAIAKMRRVPTFTLPSHPLSQEERAKILSYHDDSVQYKLEGHLLVLPGVLGPGAGEPHKG